MVNNFNNGDDSDDRRSSWAFAIHWVVVTGMPPKLFAAENPNMFITVNPCFSG